MVSFSCPHNWGGKFKFTCQYALNQNIFIAYQGVSIICCTGQTYLASVQSLKF